VNIRYSTSERNANLSRLRGTTCCTVEYNVSWRFFVRRAPLPRYPQDSFSWSWYSSPSPATSWSAWLFTPTAGYGESVISSWPPWPSPISLSVGWWWLSPESTIFSDTGSSDYGSVTSGSPSMLCAALPLSWIYALYRSIVTYTSKIPSGEILVRG